MIYWVATQVHQWVPIGLSYLIGFDAPSFLKWGSGNVPSDFNEHKISYMIKAGVYFLLSTMLWVVVIIPARVVLVRVQASLLPEDEDPIIPFDRSFDGKVEPAVVGGLGYATVANAWSTFSKAAWRRVVILYAKIFGVVTATMILSWAMIIPTALLLLSFGSKST